MKCDETQGQGRSLQGARIAKARAITLSLVFVAVIVSLAFDSGLGTPSSFGIGEFFLLCPLGGIEAMLASKSFIPVAALSLAVVLVFTLVFGRAWCAWGCPAPQIRAFFKRDPKPKVQDAPASVLATPEELRAGRGQGALAPQEPPTSKGTSEGDRACDAARAGALGPRTVAEVRGLAASVRAIGRDSRSWALVVVLVATVVAGLPLFCLVCPIGLTFGTVGSLWHLIVDKQVTLSVLVFPLALAVELVLYRKWCVNLCPIAGLLSIFGQVARLFRPRIDATRCLRYAGGKNCTVCQAVCSEGINLHADDARVELGSCTRCGECVKHCPTASIAIAAKPSDPVVRS